MKRAGHTLIEILIALAIVALAISLLLSAVQRVREAAARLQCQQNLKQLALAVHHFDADQGRLPSAGRGWNTEQTGGWLDQTKHYWERSERTVWCPVRGRVRSWNGEASSDYAAAIPTGHNGWPHTDEYAPLRKQYHPALITPADRPRSYPFRLSQSERLSNTIMLGHTWQCVEHWGTIEHYHGGWKAGFGMGTVRSTLRPPRPDTEEGDGYDYGFGGPHLGGVPVGMGDGSVRMVSWSVDPEIWQKMAER